MGTCMAKAVITTKLFIYLIFILVNKTKEQLNSCSFVLRLAYKINLPHIRRNLYLTERKNKGILGKMPL